jgi:two-component system, chemotaxis family, protein-glutamate methylesterase/glutaminase
MMNTKIEKRKIRALVVDDSVFVGMQIARILNGDDEIEVVGRARDGVEALSMVGELRPDVVTLDLEMPGQGGMTTLKHIMVWHPLPTVIISALTTEGSKSAFDAIRFGAIDIIAKPSRSEDESLVAQKDEIVGKVKRAAAIGAERTRTRNCPVSISALREA